VAQPLSVENISANIQNSLPGHVKGKNKEIIQNIYSAAGYQPLWVGEQNKKKTSQLIQALNDPMFNYKDKSFDQASISRLFYMLDNAEVSGNKQAAVYARLDMILTSSMVRLVRFIVQGDVDWNLVQKKLHSLKQSEDVSARWEMTMKPFPDQQQLFSAVVNGNIYAYLNSLIPMEQSYKKLVKMLKDYRRMDKFPKVKYTKEPLKLGDKSDIVEAAKQYLQITGDYPQHASIDNRFDETLARALTTYQKRYLLQKTGMLDKATTFYLNKPVSENIQSIITNLDKTKIYPKAFEAEHIEINIPDFNLRYYRNGKNIMKKGVVVGRMDRPTPLFHDVMSFMVLNPTWTVPDNLIKRDLIHVLREDPNYLKDNNIHVFSGNNEIQVTQGMLNPYEHSSKAVPYRFVQYPGENNALGRVKFMFPNKYSVYLHDTDNKSLLDRRYKIYSSGCVRMEQPFDLVHLLLAHAGGKYSKDRIDQILATNKPTTINLPKQVPVHMVYFTAFEEDGLAYFKYDIYMYDQIIEESVEGNKKATFTVPQKRMISVKDNAKENTKPLSN
jgi:murein L,D-transpeptidase YcbB/YkuD